MRNIKNKYITAIAAASTDKQVIDLVIRALEDKNLSINEFEEIHDIAMNAPKIPIDELPLHIQLYKYIQEYQKERNPLRKKYIARIGGEIISALNQEFAADIFISTYTFKRIAEDSNLLINYSSNA